VLPFVQRGQTGNEAVKASGFGVSRSHKREGEPPKEGYQREIFFLLHFFQAFSKVAFI
jgi:hypothetical protein